MAKNILAVKTITFSSKICLGIFWPIFGKYFYLLFQKMSHPRPLFHLFSSFQTSVTIFTTNNCEKSIQYTVLGFEPTTFGT